MTTSRLLAGIALGSAAMTRGRAAVAEPHAVTADRAIATAAAVELVLVDRIVAFAAGCAVPLIERDVSRAFPVRVKHAINQLKQISESAFRQRRGDGGFSFAETELVVVDVRMTRRRTRGRRMRLDGDDSKRFLLVESSQIQADLKRS